jgi:phosphoribosyl-dephospho-CoA transferase
MSVQSSVSPKKRNTIKLRMCVDMGRLVNLQTSTADFVEIISHKEVPHIARDFFAGEGARIEEFSARQSAIARIQ